MKSSRVLSVSIATLLVMIFPFQALAWGDVGHHLVVRLAMKRLATTAPNVPNIISGILNGEALLEATMWPDGARFNNPYKTTYNNHFIDIPFERTNYIDSIDCKTNPQKGDCAIHAIARYSKVLFTPGANAKVKRDALAFILHFVGDMHQPLHAVEKDHDSGGNGRKICVKSGTVEDCYEDSNHDKPMNLHSAWDSYIINSTGLKENGYFAKLSQMLDSMTPGQIAAIEQGGTVNWAEETHQVATQNAYEIGQKKPDGFYHITTDYYQKNVPNIEQQLLRGGIRLALVLKEIFVNHQVHPRKASGPVMMEAQPEEARPRTSTRRRRHPRRRVHRHGRRH